MKPFTVPDVIDHDESPVHNWRVSQLKRLGIPGPLAETYADASTGIRSPGWCSAAAPRIWPSESSADQCFEWAPSALGR
jgi:hypothetical protein